MSRDDEAHHIATAAASLDDKLAARWAATALTADRTLTEADARAIAAQAVRDITNNQKDRAA